MGNQAEKVFKMMANAPIGALVESLSQAVVNAQHSMDLYVIDAIKQLSAEENKIELNGQSRSLLELGLLPSFYHFSEVTLNIKMALSSMEGVEWGGTASLTAGKPMVFAASLSAHYSNRYSFSADAASEVNTKIVSIPAPVELKDLIQKAIAEKKPI